MVAMNYVYSSAQLERERSKRQSCIQACTDASKEGGGCNVYIVSFWKEEQRKVTVLPQWALVQIILGLHYNRNPEFSAPNSRWAKTNLSQNLFFCFPFG